MCDALGNPIRLILTQGQIADCTQAAPLLEGIATQNVLGDKHVLSFAEGGYDSDALVDLIVQNGANVVIPPKANRTVQRPCDYALYRERNLVERFFNKIKHYRAIATRYAKRARNYMALVALVSTILWLK